MMFDMLRRLEDEANRRTAAIRAGDTFSSLRDGPKWICRIASGTLRSEPDISQPLHTDASHLLLALRPANVELNSLETHGDGWLAKSEPDCNGKHSGYAYLGSDSSIEMVGVLRIGPWLTESKTWWPGIYELQLLKDLSTSIPQLIKQLRMPAPIYVFMNLIALSGTAIVTESDDGAERPFPIPPSFDTINFSPVLLGDLSCQEGIVNSLNKIRQLIGLKVSRPFYL
jgi:hypothetical protein